MHWGKGHQPGWKAGDTSDWMRKLVLDRAEKMIKCQKHPYVLTECNKLLALDWSESQLEMQLKTMHLKAKSLYYLEKFKESIQVYNELLLKRDDELTRKALACV